ncbi:hypothetical protein [Streptomyces sp. NPDC058295]|uniref:hypothetical protein n=1 Tax=Streptomyces sp. NPDC058295 TaxID=3346431 RepID=UPI0036EA0B15
MTETTTLLPLDGCRWCGITKQEHMQRWSRTAGWHVWTPLTQEQILARMLARRNARLTAVPAVYHAATGWAADSTGEEGIPFCADCKTEFCPRWSRVQARLDQQRWGLPRRVRKHGKGTATSGWGAQDLPF